MWHWTSLVSTEHRWASRLSVIAGVVVDGVPLLPFPHVAAVPSLGNIQPFNITPSIPAINNSKLRKKIKAQVWGFVSLPLLTISVHSFFKKELSCLQRRLCDFWPVLTFLSHYWKGGESHAWPGEAITAWLWIDHEVTDLVKTEVNIEIRFL